MKDMKWEKRWEVEFQVLSEKQWEDSLEVRSKIEGGLGWVVELMSIVEPKRWKL